MKNVAIQKSSKVSVHEFLKLNISTELTKLQPPSELRSETTKDLDAKCPITRDPSLRSG